MRYLGKGLVTKSYFIQAVICMMLVAGGSVSAAGEKDAAYYYYVGDWKKAVERYRATSGGKSSAEELLRAAEACYHLGNLDKAEEFAKMALGDDNVEARVMLYLIQAKKGSRDGAVQGLEAMLRKAPDDYKVHRALGILASLANRETALTYLSKAAEKNPDYFQAWFSMGLIYEESEMFEKASKAYRNAVRTNPLSAQAHNNLGYSYKERHFVRLAGTRGGKSAGCESRYMIRSCGKYFILRPTILKEDARQRTVCGIFPLIIGSTPAQLCPWNLAT